MMAWDMNETISEWSLWEVIDHRHSINCHYPHAGASSSPTPTQWEVLDCNWLLVELGDEQAKTFLWPFYADLRLDWMMVK